MKPKGGVTLIIAVGGGKPPHHGHTNSGNENCDMIKIPVEALSSEDEAGEAMSPEVGDMVQLGVVEGEIRSMDGDGMVHVELKTAGGQPIEYAEEEAKEDVEEVSDEDMEAQLLAAAQQADEEL